MKSDRLARNFLYCCPDVVRGYSADSYNQPISGAQGGNTAEHSNTWYYFDTTAIQIQYGCGTNTAQIKYKDSPLTVMKKVKCSKNTIGNQHTNSSNTVIIQQSR